MKVRKGVLICNGSLYDFSSILVLPGWKNWRNWFARAILVVVHVWRFGV
jgi:hypothetical protein